MQGQAVPGTKGAAVWNVIRRSMIVCGAEEMTGVAPPGALERAVQQWLDQQNADEDM